MAQSTFPKPVDQEIKDLNSNKADKNHFTQSSYSYRSYNTWQSAMAANKATLFPENGTYTFSFLTEGGAPHVFTLIKDGNYINGTHQVFNGYEEGIYSADGGTTWNVMSLNDKVGDPSSASSVTGNDAFSKISSLNSKTDTYVISSNTLSNIESALVSFGATLGEDEIHKIRFNISTATGVFSNQGYMGTIKKYGTASRYTVEVQNCAYNAKGVIITGNYYEGSWNWDSLSSKMANYDPDAQDAYTGDFDALPSGMYYVNTTTHAPSTGSYYFVISMKFGDHGAQIAIARANTWNTYIRRKSAGTWSEWKTVQMA